MARTFNERLQAIAHLRTQLNDAMRRGDSKDIIYYRGKLLNQLKSAQKAYPTNIVPASMSGTGNDETVTNLVNIELNNHKNHINNAIRENKRSANTGNMSLPKEVGLKLRRLATDISKLKRAQGGREKSQAAWNITKSSLGLAGTAIKAPIMIASKVVSKVGPLAIAITALPLKLAASFMSISFDVLTGQVNESKDYSGVAITKMSTALGNAVKSIGNAGYKLAGRL